MTRLPGTLGALSSAWKIETIIKQERYGIWALILIFVSLHRRWFTSSVLLFQYFWLNVPERSAGVATWTLAPHWGEKIAQMGSSIFCTTLSALRLTRLHPLRQQWLIFIKWSVFIIHSSKVKLSVPPPRLLIKSCHFVDVCNPRRWTQCVGCHLFPTIFFNPLIS